MDALPDLSGEDGDEPTKPEELYTDRAYDSEPHREGLRQREVEPKIPKRRTGHGSGLGVYRWVAERFFSWLHRFRKLRLRTDWYSSTHHGLLKLACSLICLSFL